MNGTNFKLALYVFVIALLAVVSFAFFSTLSTPLTATAPTPTSAPHTTTSVPTPTSARPSATPTPTIIVQTPTAQTPPTNTPTIASTPTRADAISSIRMCLAQPNLQVRLTGKGYLASHPDVPLEYYESERWMIHFNAISNRVEFLGVRAELQRVGVTPAPFDLTPRYHPEQLEPMARAVIQRCAGVNLDALTPNHTVSPTDTEALFYFFRWEVRTRIVDNSTFPFVDAGFSRGGDLYSYRSMLWYPSSPAPTVATNTPGPSPTPSCWSSQSPMPTATATPPRIVQTRTPGLPAIFPCGSSFNRQGWLTYSGTGMTQTNRAILDLHPNVKPPVLTVMYPPSWKGLTIGTGFAHGNWADQTYMDFALYKHQPGIPESQGETPTISDVFIHFVLVLDDASPDDYDDTSRLGFGALGMVIAHGTFHGYRAAFMYIGDTQRSFQRHILFQVAPGVLILIYIEFPLIQGSSPAYVQQTLAEIDGIMDSVRVAY